MDHSLSFSCRFLIVQKHEAVEKYNYYNTETHKVFAYFFVWQLTYWKLWSIRENMIIYFPSKVIFFFKNANARLFSFNQKHVRQQKATCS